MQTPAFKELIGDMLAGKVEVLVITAWNPVYSASRDLEFEAAIKSLVDRAGTLVVQLAEYKDETAQYAHWHINRAHYLESWGDARAADGSVVLTQPLIEPLYGGRTELDVIAAFGDNPGTSAYDIVRQYWSAQMKGDFETQWRTALHNGFVANSAGQGRYSPAGRAAVTLTKPVDGIEVIFRPDPSIFDGRFSNNGWLQEVSKPVTKLSWDNAIIAGVRTAAEKKWEEGDVFEIETAAGKIELPLMKTVGAPGNSFVVYLGFGRTHSGRVGTSVGRNAYLIRSVDAPWHTSLKSMAKKHSNYALVISRSHNYKAAANGEIHQFEGDEAASRGVVRMVTLEQLMKDGDKRIHEEFEEPARNNTLYPNYDYSKENQWGMVIDGTSCVGCNACVVACQSENNIPVVGRFQQQIGREMLWLRIDTYYAGDVSNPRAAFLPVPCMHCENAPCEPVCPVGATVHSPEGLNVMVYNRCVGTRYCSNNCPYKVRRFNFLLYADYETPSYKLRNNPDVTVRSRGVMEKCTYCVQRITAGRIQAEKEARPIKDGEVVTACQQSCPTNAITFGNINDASSVVAQQKKDVRNYSMLASVNTRPRTSYWAGVVNPNPELGDGPLPVVQEKDKDLGK
ncbi:MAG: 4Fe-4S dicluster domain-containing protein [Acidobacteriales bacterium]|nr:4Fe-4S dicluster domain-containing protein [Terriglobales bacterium]